MNVRLVLKSEEKSFTKSQLFFTCVQGVGSGVQDAQADWCAGITDARIADEQLGQISLCRVVVNQYDKTNGVPIQTRSCADKYGVTMQHTAQQD